MLAVTRVTTGLSPETRQQHKEIGAKTSKALRQLFQDAHKENCAQLELELRGAEQELLEASRRSHVVHAQREAEVAHKKLRRAKSVQQETKPCANCETLGDRILKQQEVIKSFDSEIRTVKSGIARSDAVRRSLDRELFDREIIKLGSRADIAAAAAKEDLVMNILREVEKVAKEKAKEREEIALESFCCVALDDYLQLLGSLNRHAHDQQPVNRGVLVELERCVAARATREKDAVAGKAAVGDAAAALQEARKRMARMRELLDQASALWIQHAKVASTLELRRTTVGRTKSNKLMHPINVIKNAKETMLSCDSKVHSHIRALAAMSSSNPQKHRPPMLSRITSDRLGSKTPSSLPSIQGTSVGDFSAPSTPTGRFFGRSDKLSEGPGSP
mmetsp:Transcript_50573/g.110702  ORF Transcript_50573/g.110702 Transcript_50573/m.110702 type:complete len:390 (+) Transcript_50573:111-1280(+)